MIPRLRRHTDGRVAIYGPSGYWLVVGVHGHWVANEPHVSHPGWSELLVAELPEPDAEPPAVWNLSNGDQITVDSDGIDVEGFSFPAESSWPTPLRCPEDVGRCRRVRAVPGTTGGDVIRTFAVSMLLVATACSSPPTYAVTAPPAGDPDTVTKSSCGVERWAVKTGSDPDVVRIKPAPVLTTIAALTSIPAPKVLPPNHRISPVETTTYTFHAVLTGFKLEADSDFHLVVSDGGKTMIVELASPTCVTSDPLKTQITAARKQFNAWYQPGLQFQHVNVPVTVTGVGSWDYPHNQVGLAPNAIELHPVLNITFDRAK